MSFDEWVPVQNELEDKFYGGSPPSVGGERLGPVIDGERAYGEYLVHTFHGYGILINCFFDFFIETMILASKGAFAGQLPNNDKYYALLYVLIFSSFRNFRAAETTMNNGYPLDGYALLRDLKDRAIHLGAIANEFTTANDLFGVNGNDEKRSRTKEDSAEVHNKKGQKEKARVTRLMIGAESGLPEEVMRWLKVWRDLFHLEVHGSRLTYFEDFRTLFIKKQLPSFAPGPHENNSDLSMYLNRSTEIGWMFHRVFPYLQLKPRSFGEEWASKWELLDHAFCLQVKSLDEMGKPIGKAFIRLIETKFAFTPDTAYRNKS